MWGSYSCSWWRERRLRNVSSKLPLGSCALYHLLLLSLQVRSLNEVLYTLYGLYLYHCCKLGLCVCASVCQWRFYGGLGGAGDPPPQTFSVPGKRWSALAGPSLRFSTRTPRKLMEEHLAHVLIHTHISTHMHTHTHTLSWVVKLCKLLKQNLTSWAAENDEYGKFLTWAPDGAFFYKYHSLLER